MKNLMERAPLAGLVRRLQAPRQFLQVVAGPRQVGKTTLVKQALQQLRQPLAATGSVAQHSVSADAPGLQSRAWLVTQWETARALAAQAGASGLGLSQIKQQPPLWGRMVESAVGAELLALEVKSGLNTDNLNGLDAFGRLYPQARLQVVGTGGIPLALWFGGDGGVTG